MKNLVFSSKTLDIDRNTRYFESKILKYYVFTPWIWNNRTINTKTFERNTWYFEKGVKSRVFSRLDVCLLVSASIVTYAFVDYYVNIIRLHSLIFNKNMRHHLLIIFAIQQARVVKWYILIDLKADSRFGWPNNF